MTTANNYADLEIRISGKQAEGYPLELTLNSQQEFTCGCLPADILPWVATASPGAEGERLFGWLESDDRFKKAWAEVRGQHPQRRLRLRLDADAPELHALPWELLREPAEGLAVNLAAADSTPFSRYLAGQWQPGSPIFKRPLKILVAMANPANLADDYKLPPLDVAQEWAMLQAATAALSQAQQVELVQLPQPCTLPALAAALKEGCHILHFIGHGSYSDKRQQAALLLADEANQVRLVSEAELAELLSYQLADTATQREDKLRLVFLASCQSATRSPADAFRGLAPRLVQAGVPAVLAMQDLVPIETAREFSQVFYQRLLAHGLVDLACNEARAALVAANLPGAAIPVLFMRLRSGELLGRRGQITSDNAEMFWPFLLDNIEKGQCTPCLGPRVRTGLLPPSETLAEKLASKYHYPLPDRANLARVAQFVALTDPEGLRQSYLELMQRGLYQALGAELPSPAPAETPDRFQRARRQARCEVHFSQTVAELHWAEKVLAGQENEIHHLLAELELPLYLTTNFDNFMAETLKQRGLSPRQVGPRWNPDSDSPRYVLAPPPSFENPVVFHLNGFDSDPEQCRHVALSEDDYLALFARLAHEQETILPSNLLGLLAENSFLFLGYTLDDWEFRVLLQGLLKPLAQTSHLKKPHVGVQLELDDAPQPEQARDYLRRYLGQFNIDIYWGSPQQFVTELHSRWQNWLAEQNER